MNVKAGALVILAALVCSARGETSLVNTIYAGLALATGEGSSHMNPGLSVCVEPVAVINKYFGCGGHIDYSWLTVQKPAGVGVPNDFRAGLHLWDIAFVPKAFVPLKNEMKLAFEMDPGLNMSLAYLNGGGVNESNFGLHFGLTTGIAFTIKTFSFAFRFKNAFIEDDTKNQVSYSTVNWITFNIGIQLM